MELLIKIFILVIAFNFSACGDFDNKCDLEKTPDKDCDGDGILNKNDSSPETADTTNDKVSATQVDTSSYVKITETIELASALKSNESETNELLSVGFNFDTDNLLILKNSVTNADDGKKHYPLLNFKIKSSPQVEQTNLLEDQNVGLTYLGTPVIIYQSNGEFFTIDNSSRIAAFDNGGTLTSIVNAYDTKVGSNSSGDRLDYVSTAFEYKGVLKVAVIPYQIVALNISTGSISDAVKYPKSKASFGASTATYFDGDIYVLSKDHSVLQKLNQNLVVDQNIIVSSTTMSSEEFDSVKLVASGDSLYFVSLVGDIMKIRMIEIIN